MGRVDLVFVLDSEESTLRESLNQRKRSSGRKDDTADAIESRLAFFRENTLPVIKHYDDEGRLVIVSVKQIKMLLLLSLQLDSLAMSLKGSYLFICVMKLCI